MSLDPRDNTEQKAKRPWISIVIPAHNEGATLTRCLESFTLQTHLPDELLIVDDSSTDNTAEIANKFALKYDWIRCIHHISEQIHLPGTKVINAFNIGLAKLIRDFDYIGKFDADIVLPPNYFEQLLIQFNQNPRLGICSGLIYIPYGAGWRYEPIADKNHVRGPIKFYSRTCFETIGGLIPAIGWDTADVLLARYHQFDVDTIKEMHVQHLRPTGTAYPNQNAFKQGQALYTLRYGMALGLLASLKMAWKRKSILLPLHHLRGCIYAWRHKEPFLLPPQAARFARLWRWKQIKKKLF